MHLETALGALSSDVRVLCLVRLGWCSFEANASITAAVLSMNGQKAARQLVRLLLADPLAPSEAWEKSLEDEDDNDGRGLLLRSF